MSTTLPRLLRSCFFEFSRKTLAFFFVLKFVLIMASLRIESIRCEDLPSADGRRGTTDPYIVVRCRGEEGRTPYKSNAANPRFSMADLPTLTLQVNLSSFFFFFPPLVVFSLLAFFHTVFRCLPAFESSGALPFLLCKTLSAVAWKRLTHAWLGAAHSFTWQRVLFRGELNPSPPHSLSLPPSFLTTPSPMACSSSVAGYQSAC